MYRSIPAFTIFMEYIVADAEPAKKIPKELALKVMKGSDKISLTDTSAPSEFLHEK